MMTIAAQRRKTAAEVHAENPHLFPTAMLCDNCNGQRQKPWEHRQYDAETQEWWCSTCYADPLNEGLPCDNDDERKAESTHDSAD